jgi:hypothetical protein
MELPYERLARDNKPVPSGLNITDTKMYIALRGIYQQFNGKAITVEQATIDKTMLLRSYTDDCSADDFRERADNLWKRISASAHDYAINPTIENADRFYADVFGFPYGWRESITERTAI